MSWIDKDVLEKTTFPRYSSVYSWPLNLIQFYRKKHQVHKQLKVFEWKNKSIDEIKETVQKMCTTLVNKLGDNKFFYGTT